MLQFEVTSGEYAGTTGTAFCGTRATVKSNRGKYLAWLAGEKAPRKDLCVDVGAWIGRRYRIDVTIPAGAESARVTRFRLLDDAKPAAELVSATTGDDEIPF